MPPLRPLKKQASIWAKHPIRFLCLAMTDAYIDAHFDAILSHASDVEARLDDSGCTVEKLKADNRAVAEGFLKAGEAVTRIETNWEAVIEALRNRF